MYHDVKWMLITVTDLPCTLHKKYINPAWGLQGFPDETNVIVEDLLGVF